VKKLRTFTENKSIFKLSMSEKKTSVKQDGAAAIAAGAQQE